MFCSTSKKYFIMVKSWAYWIQHGQGQESSSTGLGVTCGLTPQSSHQWSSLYWVTSTMVSWWVSEPSQLKAKAESVWNILLLFCSLWLSSSSYVPAFSIQIPVVQRWCWEEWAADEEIHLRPAQFEKEKTGSPVLIVPSDQSHVWVWLEPQERWGSFCHES